MRLRVLSYNIHKGFRLGNRGYVLKQIREAIRSVKADVVFLQEVHGHGLADHPDQAQFEYLADTLWQHYAYGRNAVYEEGDHGNAILSRFPVSRWENIDLSTNPFEKRGLLHAVLEVPDAPTPRLHALCTHLNLWGSGRQKQCEAILKFIHQTIPSDEPVLLCGDFNDWRGHLPSRLRERVGLQEVFEACHGAPARSFPSFFPVLRLDRIHARGLGIHTATVCQGEPWSGLSDHLGVLADLEWSSTNAT